MVIDGQASNAMWSCRFRGVTAL